MTDWDDAQLDALSTLSQADVPEAQAAWRTDSPIGASRLLDATEEEVGDA